jgi:hypothetical protein
MFFQFLCVSDFSSKRRFPDMFFASSIDFRKYFNEATITTRKL